MNPDYTITIGGPSAISATVAQLVGLIEKKNRFHIPEHTRRLLEQEADSVVEVPAGGLVLHIAQAKFLGLDNVTERRLFGSAMTTDPLAPAFVRMDPLLPLMAVLSMEKLLEGKSLWFAHEAFLLSDTGDMVFFAPRTDNDGREILDLHHTMLGRSNIQLSQLMAVCIRPLY